MSEEFNHRKCLRLTTGQITRLRTIPLQGKAEIQKGNIGNVSKAGVFVETPRPFPIGTVVEFDLRLPNWSTDIHIMGIVRRCQDREDPVGVGIEFTEIDMNAVRALDAYVDAYKKEMESK